MVQVNSRVYNALTSLEEEYTFDHKKNYLCDLNYLSILNVVGDQAKEFLQGQLTCDVREISTTNMRQGALCNLKGRILALMDIVDWQGMRLILPEDLLEKTQLSLEKTALLSRVKLQKTASVNVFGLILNQPNDILPCSYPTNPFQVTEDNKLCCYRLSEHRCIILIDQQDCQSLCDPFKEAQQFRGSLLWHQQQLKDRQVDIYPNSRGLFLPHRLELHKTHQISFNKGCYKGQEIIARTHYLAKQKHCMAQFVITTNESLTSGQRLLEPTTLTEIGELVDYCPLGKNNYLIAASVIFEYPSICIFEGHLNKITLNKA